MSPSTGVEESNTPSIRSFVVDEERMRPVQKAGVSSLCFLQCLDNIFWVKRQILYAVRKNTCSINCSLSEEVKKEN